jgi:deaminated glutathione amidase
MLDLRVAAIQMVSRDDVSENLDNAYRLLQSAADSGAQLVLLPENFAYMSAGGGLSVSEGVYTQGKDPAQFPIQFSIQSWARELNLWLVAGSVPLSHRPDGTPVPDNRTRQACLVYDASGEFRARYDKIHLFDVEVADAARHYRESATIEPGELPVNVSLPSANLGLSICFDLRFPGLYQFLSASGAEIFVVPSAFTYATGKAHWLSLLRARAIENGCFVIAANQGGEHSSTRNTWGHSMIIDPWGDVLAQAEGGEAVVVADLKSKTMKEIRTKMPLLSMRRL